MALANSSTESAPFPDLGWVRPKLGNTPRLNPAYFGLTSPYMLLIPGASEHREAKRWPVENYIALAGRIADAGIMPALIGGTAEGQIAHEIVRREPPQGSATENRTTQR